MAIVVNFWSIGLALFLSPYLIRKMGEEGYGIWVLVASFSVASGYLSLLDPGIQGATIKFVAQHHATGKEEQLRKAIWTSLLFFLSVGLGSSAFSALFGTFFATRIFNVPHDLHRVVRILFGLQAIKSLFDFLRLTWVAVYSGLERYDLLRLIQIGSSTVAAGLMVVFLTLGYDITFAGVANLLASVLSFLVMTLGLSRLLPSISIWSIPRNWKWEDVKPLLRLSSGLFGFRITGVIFRQIDKLIIPIILTSTALTPYSVANYFYQVSQSTRGFVSGNFVPIASSLAALNSKTQLKDTFLRGTRFTLAFALPTAMVGIWLAEPAVTYWVGEDLIQAVPLARILLAINFFAATTAVGFNMMIGMNRIKSLLMINLSSSMLNIVLSVALTKILGLTGTVIATLLSYLIVWYPYNHLYLKTLQITWSEYFERAILRPYWAAGILLVLLWIANFFVKPTNLVETIVLGGGAIALYMAIFFIIGLDDIERESVRAWLRSYLTKSGEDYHG